MTNMQLITALQILRPSAQWLTTCTPDGIYTIIWLDQFQSQPTNDEILAQIATQGN